MFHVIGCLLSHSLVENMLLFQIPQDEIIFKILNTLDVYSFKHIILTPIEILQRIPFVQI